jgi:hypothetical protein
VLPSKKLRDFVVFVLGFAGVILHPVDVLTSQLERSTTEVARERYRSLRLFRGIRGPELKDVRQRCM